MSGGVYPGCHPGQAPGHSGGGHDAGPGDLDPGQSLEQGEWNPLLCFLCHQVKLVVNAAVIKNTNNDLFCQTYREPCLLACYHTFCASCLKGRSLDGKLSCPICG